MAEIERPARPDAPSGEPVPQYRPLERFWPYADLAEQPSDDELAALNPDLAAALFGRPAQPFSLTFSFAPFDGPDYARALDLAKASVEYREVGSGPALRHRARFRSSHIPEIQQLWEIICRVDGTEVLVDDQPIPYAKELWLPLLWLLTY